MAQSSTTDLSALPLASQNGPIQLQASEKNVVVANMAAELAAKREMGSEAAAAQGPPPTVSVADAGTGPRPPAPLSAPQQVTYARGVADAAATGALSLPARDVVPHPGGVSADPSARPLHVPRQGTSEPDYIAHMERVQQARAQARARQEPVPETASASGLGITGDAAVQAAAIAGLLFLISQLPATRAFAMSLFPKLFSGNGGLTSAGATGVAIVFGAAFYGASIASNYLSA